MNKSIQILIVDDDSQLVQLLTMILAREGYTIHNALSGIQALHLLQQHPINVLLTDYSMPGMNGVELIRETRKTHPHLIIFMITAYSNDYISQYGTVEGLQSVITKPLNIKSLRMQLAEVLSAVKL